MAKHQYMPIIFIIFALIIICAITIVMGEHYGEDWNWISRQNAAFLLILSVLGIALIVLVGWLRDKK